MDAEAVILALAAGYYGQDGHGAGLLIKRGGRWHTPKCSWGQYLVAGDSLRGGQPCSDRCQQIAEAIRMAADWLKEHASTDDPVPVKRLPTIVLARPRRKARQAEQLALLGVG